MRQVFGEEFRREAVRLAQTNGLSQDRLAADLEIGKSTLSRWISLDQGDAGPKSNSTPGDVDLLKEADNLLDRDFEADGPNQKWAGDISYVWTAEGQRYLAVVLHLHSRRVIG